MRKMVLPPGLEPGRHLRHLGLSQTRLHFAKGAWCGLRESNSYGCEPAGFEPATSTVPSSPRLVPGRGIKPLTSALRVRRSITELTRRTGYLVQTAAGVKVSIRDAVNREGYPIFRVLVSPDQ